LLNVIYIEVYTTEMVMPRMQVRGESKLCRILQKLRMNYLQGSTSNTKMNESLSRVAWPPLRENYVSETNRHECRFADKFVRTAAKETLQ